MAEALGEGYGYILLNSAQARSDKRYHKYLVRCAAKRKARSVNRARGEQRTWGKVTNRSKNGAALFSTMQLVPGVSQGRNTGGKRGK